jgi:hypothetical protein
MPCAVKKSMVFFLDICLGLNVFGKKLSKFIYDTIFMRLKKSGPKEKLQLKDAIAITIWNGFRTAENPPPGVHRMRLSDG